MMGESPFISVIMKKILFILFLPILLHAEDSHVVQSSESFGRLKNELESMKSQFNQKELNALWKKANRIAEINDRCSSIQLTEKIDDECSQFFKVELPAFEEEFMRVSGEIRIGSIKIAKNVRERAFQISACSEAMAALFISKGSLMRLDGEFTNLEPLDLEGDNIQADYEFVLSFDKKKINIIIDLANKWLKKCGDVVLSKDGDFAPLFKTSLNMLNDSISKKTDIDISVQISYDELIFDDFDTLGGNYYVNGKSIFSSRGTSTGAYLIINPQKRTVKFPEESASYTQYFKGSEKFIGVSDFSGRWIVNTKKMEKRRLAIEERKEHERMRNEKKKAQKKLMKRYTLITDQRDGTKYKTIKIGQTQWFAENLNINLNGSSCYNNQNSYCNKYGRLYQWKTAKNACPDGWRLPTTVEYSNLLNSIRGSDLLKANNSDWMGSVDENDEILFSALPAGYTTSTGTFTSSGASTRFWTSTEYQGIRAYYFSIDNDDAEIKYGLKQSQYSVRCVKK